MKGDFMTKTTQCEEFKSFRDDMLGNIQLRDTAHKEKTLRKTHQRIKDVAKDQNFLLSNSVMHKKSKS